jgi:hypothetical protein
LQSGKSEEESLGYVHSEKTYVAKQQNRTAQRLETNKDERERERERERELEKKRGPKTGGKLEAKGRNTNYYLRQQTGEEAGTDADS